jgi:hypothetical protein
MRTSAETSRASRHASAETSPNQNRALSKVSVTCPGARLRPRESTGDANVRGLDGGGKTDLSG